MSLFYDRTSNITGVELLTGFNYNPEYGSSVNFTTKNNYFGFTDRQANIAPMGLNTVIGDYSINLHLRETDAQKFIRFYENQSGTGVFPITDNSSIYRVLSGTIGAITSLDSDNNGKYTIGVGFSVERNSSVLNWSGQSFVNHEFRRWETGQSYEQYDVVWFENDLEEPSNNFFYCSDSHVSSFANHPLSSGEKWTKDLFLDSNDRFSFNQKPIVSSNDFKESFFQRVNDQKNIHAIESVEFSYKNISDKKTKALLHFCESRLGFKRFGYSFPEIYNRPKVFFAPSWTHKWNYKDSNDFKITATEDPFGVIPSGKPSIYLVQEAGHGTFAFSITGYDRVFFDTGNGKQLATGSNYSITWANSSISHPVRFWGKINGFSGINQSISKAQFGNVRDLTHLNLAENNLGVLNIYDSPNLYNLNVSGNQIGGFDLAGKNQLAILHCENNNASYLNICGCDALTGLHANGNRFPTVYTDGAFRELAGNNTSSGYANLSGSSGVSSSTLTDIGLLSGRNWECVFSYIPPPAPTPEPSISVSPSWPPAYSFNVAVAPTHVTACSLTETIPIYGNSSIFLFGTRFHFSDETDIVDYAVNDTFYVQNSSYTFLVRKACCDIVHVVSGPTLCISSPSIGTSGVSPSTSAPSLASGPCYSPSPSDGEQSASP